VRDGVVTDAPAALQDLAPTFLDYAGATVPETMTAPSMRPVLEGKSEQHREVAVGGLHDWRLATDGRYALVRTEPDAEPMLFDRAADPWEETDVAAEHPEIVARLRPWLDAPAG
jgi:arylsulfatase A-like enzyme